MTRPRRLTDSDVEALISGHTPPDRGDLAATASFLRELPAQLSESNPIELTAPPRRRTRLLVGVAATAAAVLGLAGVVALRGDDTVVRPAVDGAAASAEVTTTTSPASTESPAAVRGGGAGVGPVRHRPGTGACGPKPDPAAFGLESTTTTAAPPSVQQNSGSSACTGRTDRPGLVHPDVLTC